VGRDSGSGGIRLLRARVGRLSVIACVLLIPIFAAGLIALGEPAGAAGGQSRCHVQQPDPQPTQAPAQPAKLEYQPGLTGSDHPTIPFGRTRDAVPRTFYWRLTSGTLPPVGTRLGPLVGNFPQASGSSQLPGDIAVTAEVAHQDLVKVTLCYDPSQPHGAADGKYVGSIGLDDNRASADPVTVDVTIQYGGRNLVAVLAILTFIAATFAAWLASFNGVWPPPVPLGTWTLGRLYSVAAALVAVGLIFWKQYLDIPTWNVTNNLLPFIAAAYAGAFSALGAGLALRPKSKRSNVGAAPASGSPPSTPAPPTIA
jgi:hypothetical protein